MQHSWEERFRKKNDVGSVESERIFEAASSQSVAVSVGGCIFGGFEYQVEPKEKRSVQISHFKNKNQKM